MSEYDYSAFYEICDEAEPPTRAWVSLYERIPFYGGAEEGGWWGEDVVLCASQHFTDIDAAQAAKDAVVALAEKYTKQARSAYYQQCRDECDWLDERGLDDDYLPQPNGPNAYFVCIEEKRGEREYRGCRHYE